MKKYLTKIYLALFFIYFIFSFTFTDPNLTLINFAPFLKFQNFMWQNFLPSQSLRTGVFLLLIVLMFVNYFLIIKNFEKLKIKNQKKLFHYLLLLSFPLVISYNALSYDVFNYIFNSKILIQYCSNPHIRTALDFPNDPWIRFMNNTHTPAPYGYGWTAFSVIPFALGMSKFLTTWLSFKFFSFLSFIFLFFVIIELMKKENKKVNLKALAILFFNPFFLIEVLGNAHNDVWMIWPALLAIYYAKHQKKTFLNILSAIVLIAFSVSVKFSTLAILPLILYLMGEDLFKKIKVFKGINQLIHNYFYDFAALLMFIPLLTERSKQFLPWYLIWSLVFHPLMKSKIGKELLIVFSVSSLLRYIPWLVYLPWMSFHLEVPDILPMQKLITWLIPGFYLLIKGVVFLFNRNSEK